MLSVNQWRHRHRRRSCLSEPQCVYMTYSITSALWFTLCHLTAAFTVCMFTASAWRRRLFCVPRCYCMPWWRWFCRSRQQSFVTHYNKLPLMPCSTWLHVTWKPDRRKRDPETSETRQAFPVFVPNCPPSLYDSLSSRNSASCFKPSVQ